jgi:hypothetical protein
VRGVYGGSRCKLRVFLYRGKDGRTLVDVLISGTGDMQGDLGHVRKRPVVDNGKAEGDGNEM